MCGIAGVAALNGVLDPAIGAALEAMTDSMWHRGPDGSGFFRDQHVGLGHRRLAIIDREGGKQPLCNEDESCWITFNGEIYNHRELRAKLIARGHRFRTRSDTEAIVHAFEEYGTACVDHLEGMFAFAIYNCLTRELFIARDRLGKKPLFYAVLAGVLHFASELQAFHQSPAWDPAIDLPQLESYFCLGYVLAPQTMYRHVLQLEPGHWLRLNNGSMEVRRYWDVERFDDYTGTEDQAVEEIDACFQARVRERLESEVPLGAFLSGGIDSGLVVSYMVGADTNPILTTSVGFGHGAHNELAAARLTAEHFSTRHSAHVVEPRLEEILDRIVSAFGEPFADSSSVPTFYVALEARRHVTVALTGDGGDETFGGYDFRYIPHAIESQIRRAVPSRPLRRTIGTLGAAWPRSSRIPRVLRWGSLLENVGRDPATAYFWDLCFMKPPAVQQLIGSVEGEVHLTATYEAVTAPYRRCGSADPVQKAQYADLKVYLPNDVLTKVDRMSMQQGLEVRCPLLDRRLVELAFRIPQTLKRAGRTGKHLLKQLAAQRLPPELMRLPKRGFTAPVGDWIRGDYRHQYEQDVLQNDSLIASLVDVGVARRMFRQHVKCETDHSYGLWALWMLQRWLRAGAYGPVAPATRNSANAR